ncbi:vWA domain-containing protein [uncultured Jannaschia sp.]|uniref:vWA domain-containing protein n=1 Tax=uncultured Jannaschia sp. TaxID=293347 RepID=UPI00263A34D4|nr:vWA domain-containing protein [uncultured Jannaschia sp.]
MIALGGLVLLRPLWLVGIPVALLLAGLAARRADGMARWRRVIDADLLAVLRRRGHVTETQHDPGPWLFAAGATLVLLGLAGPATRDPDAPALRNLDAVMILLDLSPSITESGALPDAQAAVSRLIDSHGTRPVALGVYSGEAFLVGVPTEDPAGLQSNVGVVDAATMPVGGSRPDRALALARRVLADATAERPDVVFVSDGGGVGPATLDLARQMAAAGARISAVFVAPETPPYAMPPPRRDALQAMAEAGGGLIVDETDIARLEVSLADRRGADVSDAARRSLRFEDHGRWMVALALLPLGLLFRRRRPG